eukprot:scaffold247294_cov42-Prasinocladus_malaysianus.AAC.1
MAPPAFNSVTRPLWAAGLAGLGQVIGCADSGIDIDSCFFENMTISDFVEDAGGSLYHDGPGP